MTATIQIEFFGVVRSRAGKPGAKVTASTLGEAVVQLAAEFPQLAESCFAGERLRAEYLASINGREFTRDPATPLHAGDSVLILSADAGG